MHEKKSKRIKRFTDQETEQDIEKYRQRAIELGAADAKVISAKKVYVDPRVRIKCIVPKCRNYNKCASCPPHGVGPDIIREVVSTYKYALLVKLEVPSGSLTGPGMLEKDKSGKLVPSKILKEAMRQYGKVSDIVTQIESDAFYDGHYFATAFAAGACKFYYCYSVDCSVLQGQGCRVPLRSRPSMEGSSMDVYRIVTEAGWDIYPIGADCNPANVPHGTLVGLVLIE